MNPDPCDHHYIETEEPGRWECGWCGSGFWPPEDIECDLDAYAYALGMTQQISGGGPRRSGTCLEEPLGSCGTTLQVPMVPEEISGPLVVGHETGGLCGPPPDQTVRPVATPPADGRTGPQVWRRTVATVAPAGQPFSATQ